VGVRLKTALTSKQHSPEEGGRQGRSVSPGFDLQGLSKDIPGSNRRVLGDGPVTRKSCLVASRDRDCWTSCMSNRGLPGLVSLLSCGPIILNGHFAERGQGPRHSMHSVCSVRNERAAPRVLLLPDGVFVDCQCGGPAACKLESFLPLQCAEASSSQALAHREWSSRWS